MMFWYVKYAHFRYIVHHNSKSSGHSFHAMVCFLPCQGKVLSIFFCHLMRLQQIFRYLHLNVACEYALWVVLEKLQLRLVALSWRGLRGVSFHIKFARASNSTSRNTKGRCCARHWLSHYRRLRVWCVTFGSYILCVCHLTLSTSTEKNWRAGGFLLLYNFDTYYIERRSS